MAMKGFIFLLANLVLSAAFSIRSIKPDIVDIGENKKITDDLLLDDIRKHPNNQRSSIISEDNLWTSPIPYVLDRGLDLNAKGAILRALDQFRIKSCIDFKQRDSEDYYISFQKLEGCWSYIGKEFANGQNLSIGADCDSVSTVEHEILHALGFFHEQSRYDRDEYVQIVFDNIKEGYEENFDMIGNESSTTHGTSYDYLSVMHYSKDAFSKGNGSTIITIQPEYQDVIGQRLEMSLTDVEELNLLYKCNSAVAFMFYCDFTNGMMCKMDRCSQNGSSWKMVTQVDGGPSFDHTSLPSANGDNSQEEGYFMHASTTGLEGNSARLETQIMSPIRKCNMQCLQFYYFHSGNESDELNIWIREFKDEQDTTGTLRLMEQITGPTTSHWKLHHVSLNATKQFQLVFEVQKGAENSTGGFSIDDINISETECPHLTLQINDFNILLNTSASQTKIYSHQQYSKEGYSYRVAISLYETYVGMFIQLLSGIHDDQLEWPCLQRQITFQILDQNPNIQQQMSKQWSFTTDQTLEFNGTSLWDNPCETGEDVLLENNETVCGGPLLGYQYFLTLEELQFRQFLKGGSAIFLLHFEDLTPLVHGSTLPCSQLKPVNITNPPTSWNDGRCSLRLSGFSPGLVASPVVILLLGLLPLLP